MRNELHQYDIYPKVLLVDNVSTIAIKSLDERFKFGVNKEYKINIAPLEEIRVYEFNEYNTVSCKSDGNKLTFKYKFASEQEYSIRIYDEEAIKNNKPIVKLSVYAVDEDLYERVPLMGDLHAHSCRSDGEESPAVVAANYRKAGFDFFALTDHGQYKPSQEAIDAYKDVDIDLNIVNGEEVHSPENYVHIVNFGSDSSINELFQTDEVGFKAEIGELMETMFVPHNVDPYVYCSCALVATKIRERNGLPIFCHPYWISDTYNVPTNLSYALLNNDICDAFELTGGQTVHENNMQLALWGEVRAIGVNVPIVGSSDSHGTINGEWFKISKTVVFSYYNDKNEIIDSIMDLYSVAVEHYHGEKYRVHGSLRLVAYTRFLLENYFPLHDELCEEEGRLMRKYYENTDGSKEQLEKLTGRCDRLFNKYFRN